MWRNMMRTAPDPTARVASMYGMFTMLSALERIAESDLDRVVRRDAVGERGRQQHEDDQRGAGRTERPPPDELAPEPDEAPWPGRLEVAALRHVVGVAGYRPRELGHE